MAVEALGEIPHAEAVAALISLSAFPLHRAACVTALCRRAEGDVESVGRGLNDPRPDVRLAVVDALTRSRAAGASNLLNRALEDSAASVRFAANFAVSLRESVAEGRPMHGR